MGAEVAWTATATATAAAAEASASRLLLDGEEEDALHLAAAPWSTAQNAKEEEELTTFERRERRLRHVFCNAINDDSHGSSTPRGSYVASFKVDTVSHSPDVYGTTFHRTMRRVPKGLRTATGASCVLSVSE